jgi:hypothetical protein
MHLKDLAGTCMATIQASTFHTELLEKHISTKVDEINYKARQTLDSIQESC